MQRLPKPKPKSGEVILRVKAFGLNRPELDMRRGAWGNVAEVPGTECVGLVDSDPDGRFDRGQKAIAIMGGMGLTINGSYAEYVRVPASNVLAIESTLPWEELAALPESYATAWTCLHRNLAVLPEQIVLVRGATSAAGQAAVNIATRFGATVIATTRNQDRFAMLSRLGAKHVLLEDADLSRDIRRLYLSGVDAVLDFIGTSVMCDSLASVRRDGRVCIAGSLGGDHALPLFNPALHMPSGIHLSFFASIMFGSPEFPLSDVPLQAIVDRVAARLYCSMPARVFPFEDIQEAHRIMEANSANGKLTVRL